MKSGKDLRHNPIQKNVNKIYLFVLCFQHVTCERVTYIYTCTKHTTTVVNSKTTSSIESETLIIFSHLTFSFFFFPKNTGTCTFYLIKIIFLFITFNKATLNPKLLNDDQ